MCVCVAESKKNVQGGVGGYCHVWCAPQQCVVRCHSNHHRCGVPARMCRHNRRGCFTRIVTKKQNQCSMCSCACLQYNMCTTSSSNTLHKTRGRVLGSSPPTATSVWWESFAHVLLQVLHAQHIRLQLGTLTTNTQ